MSAKVHDDLVILPARLGHVDQASVEAYAVAQCPDCGGSQTAVLAYSQPSTPGRPRWLRCLTCMRPMIEYHGVAYPASAPFRTPKGLPEIEAAVWTEIRTCLGAGAHTSSAMMCRKLLFHVAVGHGLPPKDAKGRAPNFTEAINHLEQGGLITKIMRPWVERIKNVGNEANHELTPIDRDAATDLATFTLQLLVLTYEIPALMAAPEEQVT